MIFQGPSLVEWMPDVQLDAHMPARSVPRSRPYSNIVFDASTQLLVAASSFMNRFASYDEDGNIVWEPDSQCLYSRYLVYVRPSLTAVSSFIGPNISYPYCETSTLELVSPDGWITMDGCVLHLSDVLREHGLLMCATGTSSRQTNS